MILGYAAPIGLRLLGGDKHLPMAGYMAFDVDDVDIAAFESVILHEIGHIVSCEPSTTAESPFVVLEGCV